MASDAPRTSVPSANGRSAGASLAAPRAAAASGAGPVAASSAGPVGDGPDPIAGARVFVSWSGGKDAYLALQRAVRRGAEPAALVCMLHEGGHVSRGHGLPLALLQEQAAALGVPLVTRATTWEEYEATFVSLLHELCAQGVQAGVFGDIDLQAHRDWVENVCELCGLGSHLPLWQEPRRRLVDEFLAGGRATIVAVDSSRLGAEFLGLELDDGVIARLEAAGADACGEEGEYHTMVTDAPLFARAVALAWDGVDERDGHHVLRFATTPTPASPAESL
ncbi:MAG: diphthine--ammonia ligase [Actinobacteria bacterium]|nr:diphthine--ammonia ligase [Actinomycetota bacterium]